MTQEINLTTAFRIGEEVGYVFSTSQQRFLGGQKLAAVVGDGVLVRIGQYTKNEIAYLTKTFQTPPPVRVGETYAVIAVDGEERRFSPGHLFKLDLSS